MVNRASFVPGIQQAPAQPGTAAKSPQQGNFASTLARETERQEALKISSHARKRLDSSSIELTNAHMQRIDGAVQRASDKGSNQSLIMLDNLALVVSVKNRVVITAVDEARTQEGIFTNIDSVVIA
jgi:flagellar operon protein